LRARATAAVGGVPVVVVVLFLRGRPGRRVTVGVGCGVCGAPMGVTAAALAMAALWLREVDVEGGWW
jgi:CelD/BcsL family acetyltransferase involved in cellulose biosynthesis